LNLSGSTQMWKISENGGKKFPENTQLSEGYRDHSIVVASRTRVFFIVTKRVGTRDAKNPKRKDPRDAFKTCCKENGRKIQLKPQGKWEKRNKTKTNRAKPPWGSEGVRFGVCRNLGKSPQKVGGVKQPSLALKIKGGNGSFQVTVLKRGITSTFAH